MNSITIEQNARLKRWRVRTAVAHARLRRRRRAMLWVILAALTLIASWDLSWRLDEVTFGALPYNGAIQ